MVEAKKVCEGRKWCPAGTVANFKSGEMLTEHGAVDLSKVGHLFHHGKKQ